MITTQVYFKHTDCKGKSTIQSHWVWDAARFLKQCMGEVAKMNEDELKKNPPQPALAHVQVSDRQAYIEANWPKK